MQTQIRRHKRRTSSGKVKVVKSHFRSNRKKKSKVAKVMSEWKAGKLHSGSKRGPIVKSRKQAIAIALSEQRKANKKKS